LDWFYNLFLVQSFLKKVILLYQNKVWNSTLRMFRSVESTKQIFFWLYEYNYVDFYLEFCQMNMAKDKFFVININAFIFCWLELHILVVFALFKDFDLLRVFGGIVAIRKDSFSTLLGCCKLLGCWLTCQIDIIFIKNP